MYPHIVNAKIVSEPEEYCLNDKFHPDCPGGEIIMVTSAKFGRMEIGDCVPVSFGKVEDVHSKESFIHLASLTSMKYLPRKKCQTCFSI